MRVRAVGSQRQCRAAWHRAIWIGAVVLAAAVAGGQEMPPPKPKAAPPPAPKAAPKRPGMAERPKSERAGAAAARAGMVRVPGGPFFMGCNASMDSECDNDEKPGRTVEVATFWIDRTEVTVADYYRCVAAERCANGGLNMPYWEGAEQSLVAEFCNWDKPGREKHPINCLSWDQALAYCEWAGKRLPREAEWEKAARGTDGRRYPWGNAEFGAVGKVANIADESVKRRLPSGTIAAGYDDGWVGTAPVGSYPAGASPNGALDMSGNVSEWVEDQFDDGRALRGGSWYSLPPLARVSYRNSMRPEVRHPVIGVRCAQ